jgi:hypothetical protein
MARRKKQAVPAQAWIELEAEDPEALSTLDVARAHLEAGRDLESVRRLRLFELSGRLPANDELADLLHRSTQFYNPHKEKCTVRREDEDPAPLRAGEWLVLVVERGGDRRPAAERWWHHETGKRIEVREGVAWALGFRRGGDEAAARGLAELKDRAHGLLCNPHFQDCVVAHGPIPLPLWATTPRAEPQGESA